jgi:hypothetical protein
MTFVEPLSIARAAVAPSADAHTVPARLLSPLDSASAKVGDAVDLALLAPWRTASGAVAGEGATVTGRIARVERARAFGRDGQIAIRVDAADAGVARSEAPIRFIWPPLAALAFVGARDPADPARSTFFGRAGAGWSGFLVIGAAVAQASEPVALGFGAYGLARSTWVNVLRKGRDVVLPANSIVLLTAAPSSSRAAAPPRTATATSSCRCPP